MTETTLQEDLFIAEWRAMAERTHQVAVDHGWVDPSRTRESVFPEKVLLMHTELSEAVEAFRSGDDMTAIRFDVYDPNAAKPLGIATELADVVIRIMDMCVELGVPVAEAIVLKNRYNATREYRHGGKKL